MAVGRLEQRLDLNHDLILHAPRSTLFASATRVLIRLPSAAKNGFCC